MCPRAHLIDEKLRAPATRGLLWERLHTRHLVQLLLILPALSRGLAVLHWMLLALLLGHPSTSTDVLFGNHICVPGILYEYSRAQKRSSSLLYM